MKLEEFQAVNCFNFFTYYHGSVFFIYKFTEEKDLPSGTEFVALFLNFMLAYLCSSGQNTKKMNET